MFGTFLGGAVMVENGSFAEDFGHLELNKGKNRRLRENEAF